MNKEELLKPVHKGEEMLDYEDNQMSYHAQSMRQTLKELYDVAKEQGLIPEPDYPKDLIY